MWVEFIRRHLQVAGPVEIRGNDFWLRLVRFHWLFDVYILLEVISWQKSLGWDDEGGEEDWTVGPPGGGQNESL